MSLSSLIPRRLRALFRHAAVEREMAEELRLHLELQAQQYERQGLAPADARRAAVHAFGGLEAVKESYRDARGVRPLENLMQDARYALRTLLHQRAFTFTAVSTLAIGLGATASIFTLLNTTWLGWSRDFRDADRLTMLYKTWSNDGSGPASPFDFRDWQRDATTSFVGIAAYMRTGVRLTSREERVALPAVATTANFFGVLGVRPLLGRFFRRDEEQWGQHHVAVLGWRSWQREFAADPHVIGRKVTIDGVPATIVGVAPRGAWFGAGTPDVFIPLSFTPTDTRNSRTSHFIFVVARLAPNVSLDQARAELRGVADRIRQTSSENEGTSATVEPLEEVVLGDVKPTLRLLTGAVLLVLVIACANIANLLLVRGASRSREIAVRSALGASSRRIVQQMLTEAILLAVVGGILGMALAVATVRALAGTIPLELPRVAEVGVHLDWRVALVGLALALLSGALCALPPALQSMRLAGHQSDALREGSRSLSGGRGAALVRSALVTGQVAIALVLLVTSALFARSLWQLAHRDIGVRPEHVMSVRLVLPASRALDSAASVRFFDEAVRRVSAVPGVTTAGVSSHLPLSGGGETKSFFIDGHPPATLAEVAKVVGRMESGQSLAAFGATLVRGRWFTESDRGQAPLVAIIGESVARRYFKDSDPIGQRIVLHPPETLTPTAQLPPGGRWPRWTVVGVVRDVNYGSPRDEPESAVYVPYPQGALVWSWGPQWLVARTAGEPAAYASAIRAALRELDPDMPLGDMLPLTTRTSESLRAPKFTTALVATFATVAVLLAIIGLYGVIAYAVSREAQAFGVRIALGATTTDVLRHVLARGLRLSGLGVGVGLAGSLMAAEWIKSQLFGVGPFDPVSVAGAAVLVIALTLLASYLPARRAARVDPLVALRAE